MKNRIIELESVLKNETINSEKQRIYIKTLKNSIKKDLNKSQNHCLQDEIENLHLLKENLFEKDELIKNLTKKLNNEQEKNLIETEKIKNEVFNLINTNEKYSNEIKDFKKNIIKNEKEKSDILDYLEELKENYDTLVKNNTINKEFKSKIFDFII